jgi:hypothetical protein
VSLQKEKEFSKATQRHAALLEGEQEQLALVLKALQADLARLQAQLTAG